MKKRIMLTLACLISFCSLMAQFKTSEQIVPMDTAIRYGVLDNGLAYYVAKTTRDSGKAEFRLVQKTGSLVEEDNERGMAHFLEHMLFQGTKHFPGNSIYSYLYANGVPFGYCLNAFTSQENTVYSISKVPTIDNGLLDSCLLILRDWSADMVIDKEEFERERSVIVEEWRGRNYSPSGSHLLNSVFAGTRYAERGPIGDMDIIKSCTVEQMMSFYKKWYQPQNQCVIVAGDINVDSMVEKIYQLFGDLKHGTSIVPEYALPQDRNTVQVNIVGDNLANHIFMELMSPIDMPFTPTVDYYKQKKTYDITLGILNKRMEGLNKKTHNFYNTCSFVRDYGWTSKKQAAFFMTNIVPDDYACTMEKILMEVELMKKFGVTDKEINEVLYCYEDKLKSNEDSMCIVFNDTTKEYSSTNDEIVNACIDNFMNGTYPISSVVKDILDEYFETHITKDMVQQCANEIFDSGNISINIILPCNNECVSISKEDVINLISKVETMDLSSVAMPNNEELIADNEKDTDLDGTVTPSIIKNGPKPGKIKRKKVAQVKDYTVYALSNGIKVLINSVPDSIKGTEVRAYIPGGKGILEKDELNYLSCIEEKPIFSFGDDVEEKVEVLEDETKYTFNYNTGYSYPDDLFNEEYSDYETTEYSVDNSDSIFADYSSYELTDSIKISEYEFNNDNIDTHDSIYLDESIIEKLEELQHLEEMAKTDSLENLFKKIYCKLRCQKPDSSKFNTNLNYLYESALENEKSILSGYKRDLQAFCMRNSDRSPTPTFEETKALNLNKLSEVLDRLHSNYNRMFVAINTDKEAEELFPYIKKYIASLPTRRRFVKTIQHGDYHIKPYDDRKTVYFENDIPVAMVNVIFNQEDGYKHSECNFEHSKVLEKALQKVLVDSIRYKYGKVYSPLVKFSCQGNPSAYHSYQVTLTCNPDDIDFLISEVKKCMYAIANDECITPQLLSTLCKEEKSIFSRKYEDTSEVLHKVDKMANNFRFGMVYDDDKDLKTEGKMLVEGPNNNSNEKIKENKNAVVSISSLKEFANNLLTKGHCYEYIIRSK